MSRATTPQIKTLRRRLNLSQAKVSAIACTPSKTWERWEASPSVPNHVSAPGMAASFLALLSAVVNEFGIPLDEVQDAMRKEMLLTEKLQ